MSPKDLFSKYFPRRKKQKESKNPKTTPAESTARSIPTIPAPVQKTHVSKVGSAGPPLGKYHVPPATDGGSIYGGVTDGHGHGHRDRGHWGWGGVEDGTGNGGYDYGGHGGHGHHGDGSNGGACSSDGGGSGGGDSGGGSSGGDGGGGGGGGGD